MLVDQATLSSINNKHKEQQQKLQSISFPPKRESEKQLNLTETTRQPLAQ